MSSRTVSLGATFGLLCWVAPARATEVDPALVAHCVSLATQRARTPEPGGEIHNHGIGPLLDRIREVQEKTARAASPEIDAHDRPYAVSLGSQEPSPEMFFDHFSNPVDPRHPTLLLGPQADSKKYMTVIDLLSRDLRIQIEEMTQEISKISSPKDQAMAKVEFQKFFHKLISNFEFQIEGLRPADQKRLNDSLSISTDEAVAKLYVHMIDPKDPVTHQWISPSDRALAKRDYVRSEFNPVLQKAINKSKDETFGKLIGVSTEHRGLSPEVRNQLKNNLYRNHFPSGADLGALQIEYTRVFSEWSKANRQSLEYGALSYELYELAAKIFRARGFRVEEEFNLDSGRLLRLDVDDAAIADMHPEDRQLAREIKKNRDSNKVSKIAFAPILMHSLSSGGHFVPHTWDIVTAHPYAPLIFGKDPHLLHELVHAKLFKIAKKFKMTHSRVWLTVANLVFDAKSRSGLLPGANPKDLLYSSVLYRNEVEARMLEQVKYHIDHQEFSAARSVIEEAKGHALSSAKMSDYGLRATKKGIDTNHLDIACSTCGSISEETRFVNLDFQITVNPKDVGRLSPFEEKNYRPTSAFNLNFSMFTVERRPDENLDAFKARVNRYLDLATAKHERPLDPQLIKERAPELQKLTEFAQLALEYNKILSEHEAAALQGMLNLTDSSLSTVRTRPFEQVRETISQAYNDHVKINSTTVGDPAPKKKK